MAKSVIHQTAEQISVEIGKKVLKDVFSNIIFDFC